MLPRDPCCAGGSQMGGALPSGEATPGEEAGPGVPTAEEHVEGELLVVGRAQAWGWAWGLGRLCPRALSPRGLLQLVAWVCPLGLLASFPQSGFRQTEWSFWVKIFLFNVDEMLLGICPISQMGKLKLEGCQAPVHSLWLECGSRSGSVCLEPSFLTPGW